MNEREEILNRIADIEKELSQEEVGPFFEDILFPATFLVWLGREKRLRQDLDEARAELYALERRIEPA